MQIAKSWFTKTAIWIENRLINSNKTILLRVFMSCIFNLSARLNNDL